MVVKRGAGEMDVALYEEMYEILANKIKSDSQKDGKNITKQVDSIMKIIENEKVR